MRDLKQHKENSCFQANAILVRRGCALTGSCYSYGNQSQLTQADLQGRAHGSVGEYLFVRQVQSPPSPGGRFCERQKFIIRNIFEKIDRNAEIHIPTVRKGNSEIIDFAVQHGAL